MKWFFSFNTPSNGGVSHFAGENLRIERSGTSPKVTEPAKGTAETHTLSSHTPKSLLPRFLPVTQKLLGQTHGRMLSPGRTSHCLGGAPGPEPLLVGEWGEEESRMQKSLRV